MDTLGYLAAGFFIFGYILIALEKKFGTHKSAIALIMGGLLWVLAAYHLKNQPEKLDEAIGHSGSEIFGIIAFLLAAMALIEVLVHYRFFDMIRAQLLRLHVHDKQQFLLVLTITFFLSAVLDNISITIAMLQIARRFFEGRNLLIAVSGIIIAANAGGAWSPIGDVTTILLWLADKFTALEVITYAFLPSLTLFIIATSLLYRKLDDTNFTRREEGDSAGLSLSEKAVVGTALASFTLPLAMNSVGLPPYIGLLFGLGITWGMIEFAKHHSRLEHETHMSANLEKMVQTVDISSLKFVMGILLSVAALSTLGVLQVVSNAALGSQPDEQQIIFVNIGLGLLSSIIDNSSLVAIAIDTLPVTDPELWALTAIVAGTGGSIFVIGSAAGVIAMGSVKQLTFGEYFKIASLPAFIGLVAAIAVWALQYYLL